MTVYRLFIAYDGTRFHGWQIQPNAPSIQETLEQSLLTITREHIRLIAAGRTDSGVHAEEQVAHFRLTKEINCQRLQRSLNGILPHDIRITRCDMPGESFHAQRSALAKEYHYHIYLQPVIMPFNRPYVWNYRKPLNIPLLQNIAKEFVGTHNFQAFSNERGHGLQPKTYVRTLFRLDVIPHIDGVRLEFEGDGFLYKMVRNITGTLVHVAGNRASPEIIRKIFISRNRRTAPGPAPAQGLFLHRVFYSEEFS